MAELVSRVAGIGARPFARRAKRSADAIGLILMHHGVARAPGKPGDLLPPLGLNGFESQLQHLSRHYEVVPLTALSSRVRARSPGEPLPVAITFDDDLACHTEIVAPALERFGFHATFFLTGATLEGPSAFWWQDMQAIRDRGPAAWTEMRRRLADDWPWAGLESADGDLTLAIENSPPEQRDAISARLRELPQPSPWNPGCRRPASRSSSTAASRSAFTPFATTACRP